MALNSHNYFSKFLSDAPLTHNINSIFPLAHVSPYPYKDNTPFPDNGINIVGNYAGERLCTKQSSNYTSLYENELTHSKLFFVLTTSIIDDVTPMKTSSDGGVGSDPKTILGLSFAGRDTLRYINENNPNIDKFC